jgi:ATP-binding protein involved in chromosome partitioning
MTQFLCPHCNEASQIFSGSSGKEESKRLDVPLLGQIYLSPEIVQSADEGTPYILKYENSPITREYKKIASQLENLSGKSLGETL